MSSKSSSSTAVHKVSAPARPAIKSAAPPLAKAAKPAAGKPAIVAPKAPAPAVVAAVAARRPAPPAQVARNGSAGVHKSRPANGAAHARHGTPASAVHVREPMDTLRLLLTVNGFYHVTADNLAIARKHLEKFIDDMITGAADLAALHSALDRDAEFDPKTTVLTITSRDLERVFRAKTGGARIYGIGTCVDEDTRARAAAKVKDSNGHTGTGGTQDANAKPAPLPGSARGIRTTLRQQLKTIDASHPSRFELAELPKRRDVTRVLGRARGDDDNDNDVDADVGVDAGADDDDSGL